MRKLLMLICTMVLVAVFMPARDVGATYFGGKFPHSPGSTTTLYYKYNDPHRYNGNVWQGAANWRNAAARVKPTPGGSDIKLTVVDVYVDDGYYGKTWINPGLSAATYTSAGFRLNQRYMDSLNDFDRTFVATHEFGHTLGLAHTQGTSENSIMRPGGGSFTFPWYNTPMPYDRGQINNLYN